MSLFAYVIQSSLTTIQFYQKSWLKLVNAIASLIDLDGGFVFAALNGDTGNTEVNESAFQKNEITFRDEPLSFFFILYGIAFEALVRRPDADSADNNDHTLEILLALRRIFRPSVSGRAVYQGAIFSETMELLDRLALTEGFAIQGAVIDITRDLCLNHPSVEEGAKDDEDLSDDIEQLFELTKIIVLVLANILPNLGETSSPARHQLSDDAVNLVLLSLEALVDASDVFPTVIRTDLHACIIHIFTTIVGTGVCQASIVPRALPIFRRFIRSIIENGDGVIGVREQLQTCIRKFLSILANAQKRESEASLQCARNTLMASVILFMSGSEGIDPDEPLVMEFLEDLVDCLQDLGLGNIAANCTRSLLAIEPKSETQQAIANFLIPRMLDFVTDPYRQDPENTKSLILQVLIAFASTLKDREAAAMYTIMIPLIMYLALKQGEQTYEVMASRMVSLAGANQVAFRAVMDKMDSEQRASMEKIIKDRAIGKPDVRHEGRDKEEPTISLKLSFGSV